PPFSFSNSFGETYGACLSAVFEEYHKAGFLFDRPHFGEVLSPVIVEEGGEWQLERRIVLAGQRYFGVHIVPIPDGDMDKRNYQWDLAYRVRILFPASVGDAFQRDLDHLVLSLEGAEAVKHVVQRFVGSMTPTRVEGTFILTYPPKP
ncbi:hypothetical protein HYS48_05200, partial [Candidatus Woesearchaeota archaeon]|nr:hypothetical protein [Candidatus Woesearchaeota archaeon]